MNGDLYNIYYAKHGDQILRVGHDAVLRWYMSLDGKRWNTVDDHTLKSARNDAHARLHRANEVCGKKIEWQLVEATRAPVLGECPECLNPSMESDLKTYRRCPDCGWRIDFTKEQIQWLERKLAETR